MLDSLTIGMRVQALSSVLKNKEANRDQHSGTLCMLSHLSLLFFTNKIDLAQYPTQVTLLINLSQSSVLR